MPLTIEERHTRLHACADTVTSRAMDLWWEHSQQWTTACVSQLEKSLPRLAKLNRSYQGMPLLSWLVSKLQAGGRDASSAASALGKMGEKAAVVMPEVPAALVKMLRARDDVWGAASALGIWHGHNLRIFASDQLWKALTIWQLAEGERSVPTLLPSGWREPIPVSVGLRCWRCMCPTRKPIYEEEDPGIVCRNCGQPFRLVE